MKKRLKALSLTDKVAFSLLLFALVILVISWGSLVIVLPHTLQELVLREREIAATSAAQPIEAYLADVRAEMRLLNAFFTENEIDPRTTTFTLPVSHIPDMLELVIIAPDGALIYSLYQERAAALLATENTDTVLWLRAAREKRQYISPIYPGHPSYIIVSERETGGVLAEHVVAARLDVVRIWRLLGDVEGGERLYIIQQDGTLIAHSDPTIVQGESRLFERLGTQGTWSGSYTNLVGDRVLGAVRNIADSPWVMVAETDRSRALREPVLLLLSFSSVALLGIFLVVAVGRLMVGSLVQPLKLLEESSLKIAGGSFSQRVAVKSGDEVGKVAEAFNKMAAVVEARDGQLRRLSHRVIEAQEEERRRISLELHDGVGQILVSAKIALELGSKAEGERRSNLMQEAANQLETAIDELHILSENLRPTVLDDLGIVRALEWLAMSVGESAGLEVTCHLDDSGVHLNKTSEVAAYRFVQEALNNVVKHANATRVVLGLYHIGDKLILSVKDNGVGFSLDKSAAYEDKARVSLGLSGMQERLALIGGDLAVVSVPESGSVLLAELPLEGKVS